MRAALFDHRSFLRRDQPGGLHYIYPVVPRVPEPDLTLEKPVFFTVGETVIIPAIYRKPPQFFSQIAAAEIALAGNDLTVRKGFRLIRKCT